MSAFHNPTVLYLTAILAWVFAANQLFLLDKNKLEIRFFAVGQIIMGLSLVGLANFSHSPSLWLMPFLGLMVAELLLLMGLRSVLNDLLAKLPLILVGLGLLGMAVLFLLGLNVEAPLGNLEVILLGPLLATYVYTVLYLKQKAADKGPYLHMIRWAVTLKAVLLAVLVLGALAALGDSYIQMDAAIVSLSLVVYLTALVWSNVAWILEQSVASGKKLKVAKSSLGETTLKTKSESVVNLLGAGQDSSDAGLINKSISIDPVNLSAEERQALLEKLTKRERDVFDWLIQDKKNGEIAVLLNCSETSVKVHRSKMVSKLGVRTVDDLKKLIN